MKEITRIVTAELTFIEKIDDEKEEILTDKREVEKRIKLGFDLVEDVNVLKVQDFEIEAEEDP